MITIVLFLVFLDRNKGRELWVILVYSVIAYATDLTHLKIRSHPDEQRYQLETVFAFIEGSLFGFYLYHQLKSKLVKTLSIGLYFLNILVIVYTLFRPQAGPENSILTTSEELAIIILCVLFFYEQVNNPEITFLYDSKEFWIICGFFFYTTSTLFLFITSNLLSVDQKGRYWFISQIGNIVKNIFFAIAFIKLPPASILGYQDRKL